MIEGAPQGYSLWIIPPAPVYEKISVLIERFSKRFNTSRFEPHLTLLGGLDGKEEELNNKTKDFSKLCQPLTITLQRCDFLHQYFRCLFINVNQTPALVRSYAEACRIFEKMPDLLFSPHISLMYGEISRAQKYSLIYDEIGESVDLSFKAAGVNLMKTEGEVKYWKRVSCHLFRDA